MNGSTYEEKKILENVANCLLRAHDDLIEIEAIIKDVIIDHKTGRSRQDLYRLQKLDQVQQLLCDLSTISAALAQDSIDSRLNDFQKVKLERARDLIFPNEADCESHPCIDIELFD